MKKRKIAICFGGGGARGFAHLGVIKALQEYKCKFDIVGGCSIGSVIAVMYAMGFSYKKMYSILSQVKIEQIKKNKFKIMPSNSAGIESLAKQYLQVSDLSEVKKKTYINAVDVKTGSNIVFDKGDIAKIVAGSCAVPFIFSPVRYGDYYLMDGGVLNNLPANELKARGADYVISIDVNPSVGSGTKKEKFFDCMFESYRISSKNAKILGYLNSDVLILPKTAQFRASKIERIDEIIEAGYEATIEKMPQISAIFDGKVEKKSLILPNLKD